ncbi:MAG: patatin-like phospholipase family protein [Pseudomonadota bacterium]|nr:patatin-like phospholipase family protein [Pseudomonadota bacterium]
MNVAAPVTKKRTGQNGGKPVNLALQGGGSHGAFTWGVLDRLLEDDSLSIEAISGTSAGAMNAVAMADGLARDGNLGARYSLRAFWKAISVAGRNSPIKRTVIDKLMGNWSLDHSPSFLFMDLLGRVASPYDLNPLNINPLRQVLEDSVDFDLVRKCESVRLYISATNVVTGRGKVFFREELTPDMVLASACLPFMFQAVEIDGVPYWDGGYVGNPVLYPFFSRSKSADIIIVQINPIVRPETPRTAREILNRVNEVTFNSSLLDEFRAIDFVQRLLDKHEIDDDHYRRINLHRIDSGGELRQLGASSKLNPEWDFLKHLFRMGRRSASAWLEKNYDAIGVHSTLDVRKVTRGEDIG